MIAFKKISQRTVSKRFAVTTAIVLAAVALSACSAGTPAATTTAAGLSGTPIKTVTIAAVDWNGPTYENIHIAAKAYEAWINANGGINGHPLQVTTCDDKGDPTQTAACARNAVAAGAIADIGSFTYNAAISVPIYAQANTAVVGNCCSISPIEYTSPNTFSNGANAVLNPAGVARAVQDGCKAISVLELDIPGVTDDTNVVFSNIAKAYGYTKPLKFIRVPLTATDYSSVVAQATAGSDCISLYLGENNISGMMPPFAQSGGKQTLYGAQGNLDAVSTKGYETLPGVAKSVVTGLFMPLKNPVWKDLQAGLKMVNATPKYDYNALGVLSAWSGYTNFTKIAKSIKGDITPASFLKAASTSVTDNGGMTPNIDFTKTWSAFDGKYLRAFTRQVTYMKINGDPVAGGGWIDLSDAMQGKTP